MRCVLLYVSLLLITVLPAKSAVFLVTNANDAGAGSLRDAINQANAAAGFDQIDFAASYSITLFTPLPAITSPVYINGPFTTGPQIELNATTNSVIGIGLNITAAAPGTIVRGLVVHGFNGQGILIGASDVKISGCYIGTDLSGNLDRGNNLAGIEIAANVERVKIGGSTPDSLNIISGNVLAGINIAPNCDSIKICGNKIGISASGIAYLLNGQQGINATGVSNLFIGGRTAERNIISGNFLQGVLLSNCTNAVISGNYVGTSANGLADVGNATSGIQFDNSSGQIGGITPDSSNVISGNDQMGISVQNTSDVIIKGNYIGVAANGINALGNNSHGILMTSTSNSVIGGITYQEKNVISSNGFIGAINNGGSGIVLDAVTNINIQGNFIGTEKTGTLARGNASHGIQLQVSASGVVIGGSRYTGGNIISSNSGAGINFEDAGAGKLAASGTIIKGNLIGTDSTATLDLGNNVIGIILKADNCIIGDTANQEGNVIGGTTILCGLLIANGNNNIVRGNYIGVGHNGTTPIANTHDGIIVAVENAGHTATDNIIQYNSIAYNGRYGVNVGHALNNFVNNNETGNVIRFNKIYCNTNLGIFLRLNTPADQGNNGQKAPSIDFFLSTSNVIRGVTDPTMAGKKIDLYLVTDCPNCDINPQGKVWIDSVIANGSGAWSYDYTANFGTTIPAEVVATATGSGGNTSEFSTCCHAVSGLTINPSVNPVCPGSVFSLQYSNGQSGDSLMLQMTLDTTAGWTNVSRRLLTDPITFPNLTITDTTFYRFITYSRGSFATAACKDSSFIRRVDLAPTAVGGTVSISSDTICPGQNTTATLSGSTGSIQWQQSNNGGSFNNISGETSTTYTGSPTPGQSPVQYRARVSLGSCPNDFSDTVTVIIPDVDGGTITGPPATCNGDPVTLGLNGEEGNIVWQDSIAGGSWQTIAGQTGSNLSYTPSAVITTDYVRAVVTDPTGTCSDISNVFHVVSDTCEPVETVELPNALTPNGDGQNDVFYIRNIGLFPANHLVIYNRWGSKVFEADGYKNEWNGEQLPQATYYYVLDLGDDLNGNAPEKNNYHGSVTIIR